MNDPASNLVKFVPNTPSVVLAAPAVIVPATAGDVESMKDIHKRIQERFEVLEMVVAGVISGNIAAVSISGATGCGKTYLVEKMLRDAEAEGVLESDSVKGGMSPIGLYRKLYSSSFPNQVLVIDDCDDIYKDLAALNLLKNALDTNKVRRVHWEKESRVLDNEGIPNNFEFQGGIIFATNKDFEREIQRGTGMAVHYEALMSRCVYVNLGIHSKREIYVRVGQVVFQQSFLDEHEITKQDAQQMVKWISENLNDIRVLSVRTVLQLIGFRNTHPTRWEMLAKATMLKVGSR